MNYDPAPKPLEMTDPELAANLQLITEGRHPTIARLGVERDQIVTVLKDGSVKVRKVPLPGRNDPCSCGSKKKFKKCCGR